METRLWHEMLMPYYMAVEEIKLKFENLVKECKTFRQYVPFETVEGRVKTISSILDKAQKKNIEMDNIEAEIQDIAGIRLICQFNEDVFAVADLIRNRSDMKVLEERDYITNSKPSGYRSYHVIVEYEVHMLGGARKVNVEIQIRTLAMNFWGTIEHSLQYKYRGQMPPHISERLQKAADAIITLDNEMAMVRDEIMDARNHMHQTEYIISDILNNIQNLYGIANTREINKIQDEFYRLYEKNDFERLQRFANELDIIAEGYRAQSIREDQ